MEESLKRSKAEQSVTYNSSQLEEEISTLKVSNHVLAMTRCT